MSELESHEIDITGLEPAAVLQALYNGTRAQGMGILHDMSNGMSLEQARETFSKNTFRPSSRGEDMWFDYVYGRPLKVCFIKQDDKMILGRTDLYDRDAGRGRAKMLIDELRAR